MEKTTKQQLRKQFHKENQIDHQIDHKIGIVSYAAWLEDMIIESNMVQIGS